MCFHVDTTTHRNHKKDKEGKFIANTATKNIKVHKLLTKVSEKIYESPIMDARWTFSKVKKSKLVKKAWTSINEGLHSFRTLSGAKKYGTALSETSDVILEAVIPKGSKYYINKTQYVSNALKIIKPKAKKIRKKS
jgi:hypothetical protein